MLTGLDCGSIEVREVSAMPGLLPDEVSRDVLQRLMRRVQLEHPIRTARQISGQPEIMVVGSQAILGTYNDKSQLLVAATMDIEPAEAGRGSTSSATV